VNQEHLVLPVAQEHLALPVAQEHLVLQEHQEHLVLQEHQEVQVQPEHQVLLEFQVLLEQAVLMGFQEVERIFLIILFPRILQSAVQLTNKLQLFHREQLNKLYQQEVLLVVQLLP
jgi:hypothetical protein